jgi:hypothetical protein
MRLATLALTGLLVSVVPGQASAGLPPTDAIPACPATTKVDGLGDACRHSNGLLEVFAPDGASVGFTHGVDPDLPTFVADAGPSEPHCITDPLAQPYYARVIYARAHDDADLYDQKAGEIRDVVRGALGYLNEAAIDGGATGGSVHVLCDSSGEIIVEEAVLPTNMADADFSTVSRDLTLMGYNDLRAKHWVHYDDRSACSCSGTGNLYLDDSPGASNTNNGNGTQPMFAVTWDRTTAYRTWLHELGHNLGAVQNSAPNTTGAGHCIDGRDIMCYNDGGPKASGYTSGVCAIQVFDCGKNDYFNLQPAPGSYLAKKWNLGSTNNRYLWLTGVPRLSITDPRPGVVYANGCGGKSPPLPGGPTSETNSAIVVGNACVTVDALDAPIAEFRVYVEGQLRGMTTEPFAVAPDGTQTWRLEVAHGSGCCFRVLQVEGITENGYRVTAEARIIPLA